MTFRGSHLRVFKEGISGFSEKVILVLADLSQRCVPERIDFSQIHKDDPIVLERCFVELKLSIIGVSISLRKEYLQ